MGVCGGIVVGAEGVVGEGRETVERGEGDMAGGRGAREGRGGRGRGERGRMGDVVGTEGREGVGVGVGRLGGEPGRVREGGGHRGGVVQRMGVMVVVGVMVMVMVMVGPAEAWGRRVVVVGKRGGGEGVGGGGGGGGGGVVAARDGELELEHLRLLVEGASLVAGPGGGLQPGSVVDGEGVETEDAHHPAHGLACLGGAEGDLGGGGEGAGRVLLGGRGELHDKAVRRRGRGRGVDLGLEGGGRRGPWRRGRGRTRAIGEEFGVWIVEGIQRPGDPGRAEGGVAAERRRGEDVAVVGVGGGGRRGAVVGAGRRRPGGEPGGRGGRGRGPLGVVEGGPRGGQVPGGEGGGGEEGRDGEVHAQAQGLGDEEGGEEEEEGEIICTVE